MALSTASCSKPKFIRIGDEMRLTVAPKVAHLTSAHPASDARIYHKECQTLAGAGYRVTLIATGEATDVVDGVQIKCVPPARGRGGRMMLTTGKVLGLALRENADVYHFHDPELIPVGLCLKLLGRRVVYDVHEDVPRQVLSKEWIHPRLRLGVSELMASLERLGERCFDGIVAATPAIGRRFRADKTVVVQNYPLLQEFDSAVEAEPYRERRPIVAYVGGITLGRGIEEMVRAMNLLPEMLGAKLQLAGTFAEAGLEAHCRALPGWQYVAFLGWQPRPAVAALLGRARIGLILFRPEPNHIESQPNKLFEYMAAALPVVASDFPWWRQIVEGTGCGLLVDPLDPQAIATALDWLLTHPDEAAAMGERGRKAVVTTYNWNTEGQKLLAFYEKLPA